jgi:hypothetical protein
MPDLTKRESAYFIISSIAALGVVIMTLWLWAGTQENCWDKYQTEDAAIQACEQ